MLIPTVYAVGGPAILATFDLTYDRMGLLLGAGMLGYGGGALIAGLLLDVVAIAPLARATMAVAAGACVAGGLAPAWGVLGVTMVLFGAAAGVLTVLPLVFFTDLYPADRTRVMARWQMFISLAQVTFPLLIGFLLAAAAHGFGPDRGWRVLLLTGAPLFLVMLALVPGRSLGRRASIEPLRMRDLVAVLRRPLLLSILTIAMLHTAADNSTYLWIILMIKERFHVGPQVLGVPGAAYSLAYVSGRLLRGTVRWPFGPLPTIAVGSLVGAAILAGAVRAPTLAAVIALYAGAGLFFSLNWPSTLGFAGERFPDRTGTVLGAANAVTGPATMAVSALIGVVSRFSGSVELGMLLPVGLFFVLGIFAAVTHLRAQRPARGPQ